MNLNMLLFSNGQTEKNMPYYHYCKEWLQDWVDKNIKNKKKIYFISWAVWGQYDADAMFGFGQEHWGQFGLKLLPFHKQRDYLKAIEEAEAIIVSGGSIHMLVSQLEKNNLMGPLKTKIESGCPYIGTSSGSLIMGPTMHTATEPPLINIPTLVTLGVLPFQLTAHYYDHDSDEFHHGPTPYVRIKNYLQLNPEAKPVLAMRDGSYLHIEGGKIIVMGTKPMTFFDLKLNRFDFTPFKTCI